MKEVRRSQDRRRRKLGFAVMAAAVIAVTACGQQGGVGTAMADTDELAAPPSSSEMTQSSADPAEDVTESADTPSEATGPVAGSSSPATEGAGALATVPSDDAESGEAQACPETAAWDTAEESETLSLGGGIIGISGGSIGCFDSINILINPSDVDPGYTVRYVDEVTQPGSGDPVPVAGAAALEVVVDSPTFDPSTGEPMFHMFDPGNLLEVSSFAAIEQVAFGGSFEGWTTFAIGTAGRLPFTVETSVGADDFRYVTISVAHP